MKIVIVDGQGGGIGKLIVEKLRENFGNEMNIIVVGTNALATSLMLKSGANEGATGENAVIINTINADIIMGCISILSANSMLGELTTKMAEAIANSKAKKILIPLNKCNIHIAGLRSEPLPHYIDDSIDIMKKLIGGDICV